MTSISTAALSAIPRQSMNQAQGALARAQIELSSGRLADIGLGIGAATGRYVSLAAQGSRLQAIKDSNATASTKLTATTTALDALRTSATRFLTSLTGATSSGTVPGTLVAEAGADLDDLTGTLNTTVAGESIFAGINSAVTPLTAYAPGSASKAAVDASFASAFGTTQGASSASSIGGPAMQSYLDGAFADLFGASGYAATWSSASDQVTTAQISSSETVDTSVSANAQPFRQLAQAYTMVKEFGGANFSAPAGQAVMGSAMKLVSSAIAGLTSAETAVGASQSAVSDADDRITSQVDYLTTQTASMVDVDPSDLSIKISDLKTQIQASYEITSELQQLSLVNYLK